MGDSPLGRFFGVVTRPRTWLNLLFHVLAFPLGLFYFIFLIVGLALGLGLVIIWVGIPILLVVAGAWWLFGAFERLTAQHLLGADVGPAPRAWENVNGVWGRLKAHFGSGSTWKDLAYLLAKLPFGIVSFTLLVVWGAIAGWLLAFPVAWNWHFHVITWDSNRGFTPPLWLAILAVPGAVLMFFAGLHLMNAWSWICARWAEIMLRTAPPPAVAVVAPQPLVTTAPPAAPAAPASPAPPPVAVVAPVPLVTPAPPPAPAPPAAPAPPPAPAPPAAELPDDHTN